MVAPQEIVIRTHYQNEKAWHWAWRETLRKRKLCFVCFNVYEAGNFDDHACQFKNLFKNQKNYQINFSIH